MAKVSELPKAEDLQAIREEYKAPVVIAKDNKTLEATKEEIKGSTASQPEPKVEVTAVIEEPKILSPENLSDDELIALLERRGKKIATETLTPEQQRKQADLEDTEKKAFAIAQLNVTAEQYDEIKNVLNADGADLTKREFEKSYKTENKGASKEEVESAYKDYYNLAQTVKVKERQKKEIDGIEEEVEVDVEKPKFDEKLSKWGEQRIKTKAERIKDVAKANQKYIDDRFTEHKALLSKANDYVKTAEKVLSEIDFGALPVSYKFGKKGEEKEIKAIVKLDDAAKAEVIKYVNTDLADLIVRTDKFKDADEIKNQVIKFTKERFSNQVGESLYNLGHTSGIREGAIGGSAPITSTNQGGEVTISELEKSVVERLPENPLIKNRK